MSVKTLLLILSLALTVLFFSAQTTNACSCGPKATVQEAYDLSAVVVIAQILSVEKSESARSVDGIRSTRMVVEKVFKGTLKPGEEMIFAQGSGADCMWGFGERSIGQRFLFYLSAKAKEEDLWFASICGRSNDVQYAGDDLLYLGKTERVRGKTRISGTLSFYQTSAVEGEEPIHKNLDGIKVRIMGDVKTYELITNQYGVYEIYDLPVGKYEVQPEVPDGWKINSSNQSYERRVAKESDKDTLKKPRFQVDLGAGKHAYVDFRYGVNNAIRGKVFDTAGNSMKDVCLSLLPAHGKPSSYFYGFDCSKKDGAFEIAGIPPGTYVIAVNRTGKISSREPFPTFYYPNVFERQKAGVITIGTGYMLEGIHIYVPKMEETIVVEGVVLRSDGKPVIGESVEFEPGKTSDGIDGKAHAQTESTGRFAIKILKGLEGTLYAGMYAYKGEYENCPKLEELIKKSGRDFTTIRTNAVAIRAQDDIANIELRYSFPDCKKAR